MGTGQQHGSSRRRAGRSAAGHEEGSRPGERRLGEGHREENRQDGSRQGRDRQQGDRPDGGCQDGCGHGGNRSYAGCSCDGQAYDGRACQGRPRGGRSCDGLSYDSYDGRSRGGRPGGGRFRGGRSCDGPPCGGRRAWRRATAARESLRRLLPQALVVAFLVGGTGVFLVKDKTVALSVDGTRRTLHTFADDIGELLAEEGLRTGPHDVVAPAPGTVLADGDEVVVRFARPVRLTLDGRRHRVWTTAPTVAGALRQLGVRAEGAHLSVSRSRRIGRTGLELRVRTERTVTVLADGRSRTLRTNAATVREAVEAAGVTLRGHDTTSVPGDGFPRDGQTITVLRIGTKRVVREEAIPFRVRRITDRSLPAGTEVVERPGRPGVLRVTYTVRTVDGVRRKPRRLRADVVRKPRTRVVKVGARTGTAGPRPSRAVDALNWSALAACESGGRPHVVDPSGTYGGLYQLDHRTWRAVGGSGSPQDAPAAEQTYRAKLLYAQRGAAPWPHCGARLYG